MGEESWKKKEGKRREGKKNKKGAFKMEQCPLTLTEFSLNQP